MSFKRTRISLLEYGAPIDVIAKIRAATGVDYYKAQSMLLDAGGRVATNLGFSYNPISCEGRGVRAVDFAGLLRLGPALELEITPKFLSVDDPAASWREDFFFLSTLSRHGRLLVSEQLSASGGAPRDISALVARSISSMYESQKRRPLRRYRKTYDYDFVMDGDPDPVDLLIPSPDGFAQERVLFDRKNHWNADIVAAAKELLPEIGDPSTASSIVRLIEDLSPQGASASRARPIPARHRAWKPLHDLSIDVLNGLGLSYKSGNAPAPGYVVATWRVWEDLLTVALRLGFGRSAVTSQKGHVLGVKTRLTSGVSNALSVFPDCLIESDGSRPRMLLDAKYKGHVDKGRLRIAEADIYESLAFARATGTERVILAYPALPASVVMPPGTCTTVEKVEVDSVTVIGIQVETRSISKAGALRAFSSNLASAISHVFEANPHR